MIIHQLCFRGHIQYIWKRLTIFVKQRKKDGLHMFYSFIRREETSKFIAKKGNLISTDESTKILLEQGSQHFQSKDKVISTLFDKYLLDIQQNENNSLLNRWKSPAENFT